ncbi:hypothetical protein G9A89_019176 [Geosiphon pyriformis]|nr:hypothetical protein G9A89_019176 [Geosiphon pyriformis]
MNREELLGYVSNGLNFASKLTKFSNIPGADAIVEIVRSIVEAARTAERNILTCQNLAKMVRCANGQLNNQISGPENEMSQNLEYYIECLEDIKEFLLKQQKPRRGGVLGKIMCADEVANQVVELSNRFHFAVSQLTLRHVQILHVQQSIPRNCQVEAEVMAIKDDAPIGKELLKQIRISSEDIFDDSSELIKRGNKAHIVKRVYSVQRYPIAEKSIGKIDNGGKNDTYFWKEVAILRLLEKCSSILKFHGILERNGERFSITDWAKNGDMKTYLETHMLTWTDKLKIALQIAQALAFCHQVDVLHHDVRSHNIFLDGDRNAKLTNFYRSRKEEDPKSKTLTIPDMLSAMRWTAPEKLDPKYRFTKECDVYSYAIVLWEIATQQLPYGNIENSDVLERVKNGERPITNISDIPEEYERLMRRGWNAEPRSRPKISEFCPKLYDMHKIFEGGDDSSSSNTYSRAITGLPSAQSSINNYTFWRYDDLEDSCSGNEDEDDVMNDSTPPPNLDEAIALYNKREYYEAWQMFETLADHGVLKAQYYAGLYFVTGLEPVEKDLQRGLNLWKNAADGGDRDAQYKYGFAFDKGGLAGIVDKGLSRKYIKMAYNQDHPGLLYNYGSRYLKDGDYVKAADHFQRACAQGHPKAWEKLNLLKTLNYS